MTIKSGYDENNWPNMWKPKSEMADDDVLYYALVFHKREHGELYGEPCWMCLPILAKSPEEAEELTKEMTSHIEEINSITIYNIYGLRQYIDLLIQQVQNGVTLHKMHGFSLSVEEAAIKMVEKGEVN